MRIKLSTLETLTDFTIAVINLKKERDQLREENEQLRSEINQLLRNRNSTENKLLVDLHGNRLK